MKFLFFLIIAVMIGAGILAFDMELLTEQPTHVQKVVAPSAPK